MKIEDLLTKIRNGEIKDEDLIKVKIMKKEELYKYEDGNLYYYFPSSGDIGTKLFYVYDIDDVIKAEFFICDSSFYIDDLELRGTNFSLSNISDIDSAETLEIVKWGKNYKNCITIGFWVMDKMGYNFRFVQDRFINIDHYELMFLIEKGQDLLNKKFIQNRYGDNTDEM